MDTRDRIKKETVRLCVERGVAGTSMRDIAEASGLKAPSIYAHFESRDLLLAELFSEGYAFYARRIEAAAPPRARFHVRLEAMLRAICGLHGEDETLFGFLLIIQHDFLRRVARDTDNPVEIICREIASAMQAHRIPEGDPALVAAAVVGVVVQAATFRLYGRSTRGLDEMADEIVALCTRIVG